MMQQMQQFPSHIPPGPLPGQLAGMPPMFRPPPVMAPSFHPPSQTGENLTSS